LKFLRKIKIPVVLGDCPRDGRAELEPRVDLSMWRKIIEIL